MGNRQSTKEKQQDKHAFHKDTKEAAVTKETDQSGFKKLPTPTSPDDLNPGKSKDLTGNINNTATTSQGLGPTKLIGHSVEPNNGKEAIFTRMHQVPAVDVPQNGEQNILMTGNISQDADLVKPKPRLQQATPARPAVGPHHGVKTSAGDFDALRSDILQQLKDAPETLSQQQSTSTAPVQQLTKPVQQQKKTTAEVPTSTPTEPPNHSTQMSNQPKTQVNNEENALQEPGLNHNNVTTVILVNYQYCFRAKSETSRAYAGKMRLRQKLAKKLKAQPQDGSKSSQQTVEETVTVEESPQQQGCTAMRAKKHKKPPHQIPQHNKADYDNNGNPSSCIQKVSVKASEPAGASNITATHHQTTATAAVDPNVKLRLQCQLKASLPQDTAVKPKKKCSFIPLNQNQPKENAGNVTIEEKLNGNNGHVGKERPEPAFTPAPNPEHKVHAEGHWHPFTVNQSCSCKARCHHNPGKGLPPNVQKWFDECPNYLCEPPWNTTAKRAACLALREAQEDGRDSHQ